MTARGLALPLALALAGAALPSCGEAPAAASDAACAEVAGAIRRLPGVQVREARDSFPAFTGPGMRYGCVVQALGSVPPEAPVPVLATSFPDSLGEGWERDGALVADGPSETVYGLRRGDVLCLVRVEWAGASYAASVGCEPLPDSAAPPSP